MTRRLGFLCRNNNTVANLINRIEVSTEYQVHIDFNIDLSHFNIQLDICAQRKNPPITGRVLIGTFPQMVECLQLNPNS